MYEKKNKFKEILFIKSFCKIKNHKKRKRSDTINSRDEYKVKKLFRRRRRRRTKWNRKGGRNRRLYSFFFKGREKKVCIYREDLYILNVLHVIREQYGPSEVVFYYFLYIFDCLSVSLLPLNLQNSSIYIYIYGIYFLAYDSDSYEFFFLLLSFFSIQWENESRNITCTKHDMWCVTTV